MNFVVENSNKLQKIGFRKENELSVLHLGPTTHVTLLMSRGAPSWFKMFGAMVWNLSIIEPFFH